MLLHSVTTTVQAGTVYEEAVVQRVLPDLGVVFRLPGGDGQAATLPAAGFAHISALSDTRVDKIHKVGAPLQPHAELYRSTAREPADVAQVCCIPFRHFKCRLSSQDSAPP